MHDLALHRSEVLWIADHAVVEPRAHRQQHVAVLHGHVGLVGPVHAEHAEELRIARRRRAEPHQCVRAREAQRVVQLSQLGRRVAQDHAAAGVDVRALGMEQQLQGLADLPCVALPDGVVRAHLDARRVGKGCRLQRHVLRHVDHHRPRSAGAGDVKRLLDRQGQVAHVLDEEVVLDDRARDADRVALLERIEADRRRRNLPGHDHHRDRIHVGGRDARHRVRDARARGHQRDADLSGGTRVSVGGMYGRLFVAHQHVLNRFLLVQRVVDVEDSTARVAPDELDALRLQAPDQDL
jgi:hypothetical protein